MDNVGSKVMPPTKVEVPSIPKTPSPRGETRSLPGKGKTSSSVLKTSLPPPPGPAPAPPAPQTQVNSPRASIISTDSGLGVSAGAEVHRPPMRKSGASSTPNSGSGTFQRERESSAGSHHSADAEFRHRVAVSERVWLQLLMCPR